MRWPAFFILAYLTLGLQQGLSGYMRVGRGQPDLVLLVAIFIAANAPRNPALLACFALGAMQDLLTQNPWGFNAFTYGLVGVFVIATHELVYREHILTHFSLALIGSWIVAVMILLHRWVYGMLHANSKLTRPSIVSLLTGSLYTAVLAIPVTLLLLKMRKSFGFRAPRGRG